METRADARPENTVQVRPRRTHVVAGLLAGASGLYVVGVVLLLTSFPAFSWWIAEDGPVEWLTVFALIACAIWALGVATSWPRDGAGRARRRAWIVIAAICLFAAMEEISWGQRLFGIATPEFLMPPANPESVLLYNRQGETTLHNLMIAGINVNKLVFGKLLALAMAFYLFALPLLARGKRVAAFLERHALPRARGYQAATLVLAALGTVMLSHRAGKVAEMQELVGCTALLAILVDPRNPASAVPASLAANLARWRHRLRALLPHGPRLRALCVIVAAQLVLGTALRLIFLVVFGATAPELELGEIRHALHLGFRFDLRLALLLCLPFVLLSRLPPLNPWRWRGARRAWLGYFVAFQAVFLLLYFIDFGHFDYTHVRLNAGAVDHALSAGIALGMVWQTYPVVRGLLGLALLCGGYGALVRRFALRPAEQAPARGSRRRRLLVGVALTALYLFGLYGKWSWYPLRWSDAYATTSGFASALALNPILFLYDTIPNREKAFDATEVRRDYELVANLLEVRPKDPERLSFARIAEPRAPLPFRPNLVLIHLEAFAGHKVSALGNDLNSSPWFDRLARDSILFTHFFVPTAPTARSVFTMATGIPDVNPMRSASRNPEIVSQRTLLNALEGYRKFYFLGGSATWANIRGLLAHNVEGLQIIEEGDYDAPRVNVWGVSDLDLFDKADEVLQRTEQPFFAFIQTAGNHGPHTIPEDHRDFEVVELDEELVRDNGFESLKAYNSFRLLDYSLGRFIEMARREPYFEHTLFVMYGDHGYPAPRATPWERLGLNHHHVPLLIYAPWLEQRAGRIDSVASLVDVLPTALGLMGIPYTNTTLGRDLFQPRPPERHFAFIEHGLLTDDYLMKIDPVGRQHLYAYDSEQPNEDLAAEHAAETDRLHATYEALLGTSRYLLYNNHPAGPLAGASPAVAQGPAP